MFRRALLSTVAAAALVVGLAAAARAQQRVGTAGAVNPDVTANGRIIRLGSDVIFKETIRTSPQGSAQVIFVDKTTLNIGPNSTVVIDEFVYDPNGGTNKMAIRLTKGALRIVGGNVTHEGNATVRTPVASVGIRGGVCTIAHQANTIVYAHYGNMSISSSQGTQSLYRSGFSVTVSGGGNGSMPGIISDPARTPYPQLAALTATLTSRQGQRGGSSSPPTDPALQSSGLEQTNLSIIPSNLRSLQSQTGSETVGPRNTPTDDFKDGHGHHHHKGKGPHHHGPHGH